MKKALSALLVLILTMSFVFMGCGSSPETAVDDNAEEVVDEGPSFPEGVMFMVEDVPSIFSIPENPPYNYQRITQLGTEYPLTAGDVITFEMAGTANIDIPAMECVFVNQGTNWGWENVTEYTVFIENIVAGEPFSVTFDLPITADVSAEDFLVFANIVNYDVVGEKPVVMLDKFELRYND